MKKILKEKFELRPDQGAMTLYGLKKDGYTMRDIKLKGNIATVTFILNPSD